MYDIKWVINYSYYLTYSINKLHCLPNLIIKSTNIKNINMIKYLLLSHISIINCHGSFENFTNPPNLITYLMVSSLKKVKEK